MHELPPLPSGIRTLRDDEAERVNKRYEGRRSPQRCVTCRGTGTFWWWGEGEVVDWKCDCIAQYRLSTYLLHSGVGITYQRLGWPDVQCEQGAVDKVRDYLDHADAYLSTGCGLILYGEMGTGKTLLANLVLKRLLGEGYNGFSTTFAEMIDLFASTWHDPDEKTWFYRRVKNADVLVVDDVGREHKQRRITADGPQAYTTSLAETAFEDVLRYRVANSKASIITGNLDMDTLKAGYGGNVMSLLHERSTTYRFTGVDYRDAARLRLDEEVKRGLTRPVVLG